MLMHLSIESPSRGRAPQDISAGHRAISGEERPLGVWESRSSIRVVQQTQTRAQEMNLESTSAGALAQTPTRVCSIRKW
jgi:hypothetical protein